MALPEGVDQSFDVALDVVDVVVSQVAPLPSHFVSERGPSFLEFA